MSVCKIVAVIMLRFLPHSVKIERISLHETSGYDLQFVEDTKLRHQLSLTRFWSKHNVSYRSFTI